MPELTHSDKYSVLDNYKIDSVSNGNIICKAAKMNIYGNSADQDRIW
jgi:hypothetical protein